MSDYKEPPEGWYRFGAHSIAELEVGIEFSEEKDASGLPRWERPIPYSPDGPEEALWMRTEYSRQRLIAAFVVAGLILIAIFMLGMAVGGRLG